MTSALATREQCAHYRTPNYCEENVWHILNHLSNHTEHETLHAVFISNATRQVTIRHQLGGDSTGVCIWDYHVICVAKVPNGDAFVYDIDSTLSFPTRLSEYISEALSWEGGALFRVVSHAEMLEGFSSDRRHMGSGGVRPSRGCIRSGAGRHTLPEFLDMASKSGRGELVDVGGLGRLFGDTDC